MSAIFLLIGILSSTPVEFSAAQSVGVCFGALGNNLPTTQAIVDLYKSNGIGSIRLYNPDETTLQALRGSNIEVILGVPNDNLQSFTVAGTAKDWVNKYVKAYSNVKFKYIAVGNEVDPGDSTAQYVLPAIQNIQEAISSAGLPVSVKVSTTIATTLLGSSYPPSTGVFSDSATPYLKPITSFLVKNRAPLLANLYPYFVYANNNQSVALDYALFTQKGANEIGYQNLFDAMLDSLYAALEKAGAPSLRVVVSESGWPSQGGPGATVDNAGTYYRNLINHAKGGTPKRPNGSIETYLFAMFDENQKVGLEIERHFGLFRPDKSPKYSLIFSLDSPPTPKARNSPPNPKAPNSSSGSGSDSSSDQAALDSTILWLENLSRGASTRCQPFADSKSAFFAAITFILSLSLSLRGYAV